MPDIEGIDEFRGAAFHSAQWDHSVDLTGKRVAIIGTGASAIQIVPEIVDATRRRVAALPAHPAVGGAAAEQPAARPVLRKAFAIVPGLRALVRSGIYWGLEGARIRA